MALAKESAKGIILKEPEKYVGIYTTIVDKFAGLQDEELIRMLEELDQVLSRDILDEEEIGNLKLVKFVEGKMKQLQLVIKK